MKRISHSLFLLLVLLVSAGSPAFAQNDKYSRLKNAGPRVKRHVETILGEYKNHEGYGKRVANTANQDGKQKQWNCGTGTCPGARDHDWDPNSNQNSEQDYKDDSEKVMVNEEENLRELWSCFEPGRIKYTPPPDPLDVICDAWCPDLCPPPGVCPGLYIFQPPNNRHSVYEEWRPYHVAYINNYGINRLNPSEQSQKGDEFMKNQLVSRKQESEREEKDMIEQKEAIRSQYVPDDSKRTVKGMGHSAGFFQSSDMLIDKLYGHGARTRWSYKFSEERQLPNCLGWAQRPDCIANTSPPKKNEKDVLNLWTEFGMLDVVWNMPEMTKRHSQREQDMYEATAYPEETIQKAGKDKKKAEDWIKTKSPAAFRRKTWSKSYDDLKEVQIDKSNNQKQEEFVYFGGGDLGPLTGTINATLGMPELSAGAYLSRRVFYVMGSKAFLRYHPDGEMGRMNEYTVQRSNKSREIDKMQRIWPRQGNKPSECFRSQRIPNMVNTTENGWARQNFPYDLIHYVDEHYGEMTYAYWNKVVYCACEWCSIPTKSGCTLMEPRMHPEVPGEEGRGDGDQPYGEFENLECRYREGKFPSPWAIQQQSCGAGDRPPGESVYEGNRDGNPDV